MSLAKCMKFEKPKMEIIKFKPEDIIVTSGGNNNYCCHDNNCHPHPEHPWHPWFW